MDIDLYKILYIQIVQTLSANSVSGTTTNLNYNHTQTI